MRDYGFTAGDRVRVVEVRADCERVQSRYAVPGTVDCIDHKRPWAPIQVRHDDGERWAYAVRSLERIADPATI